MELMEAHTTKGAAQSVPKGFKQTDVGLIPEDWKLVPFSEFVHSKKGGASLKPNEFTETGMPVLPKGGITRGGILRIEKKDEQFCPDSYEHSRAKACVDGSYLAIVLRDLVPSGPNLGLIVAIPDGKKYLLAQGTYAFKTDTSLCHPDYLIHYSNSRQYRRLMQENMMGSTQVFLRSSSLWKIQIPLPPTLGEQQAIAEALSDMDAMIRQLEQLIEKKKAIKQGAMQELLKPKEGWVEYSLGQLLEYEQPTKYIVKSTEYVENSNTPVLTAGKTFILGYTTEEGGVFKEPLPVIIFDDFTTASKFVDFKFKVKSSAMKILKLKDAKNNLRVIHELMNNIDFPLGDHKRHWIGEYQNLSVQLPDTKTQKRIAIELPDFENSISMAQQKLTKARQLKQGMMQELLTGRKRLV